ncbi:MAG: hypothetical protein HYV36_06850 [Lentisphaerae bacterium]|nr:hypothetical protein [Lentisphaerota bacterium]
MNLLYKPDWEETKQRYRSWWAHEYFGRCALAVTAPKKNPPATPPPDAQTIGQKWYDLDWISAQKEYGLSNTFYGGEALPVWYGGYPGHTAIPTFLGCPIELDFTTGWWNPILLGENIEFQNLKINKADRNYRFALDSLRRHVKEARGKSLVSIGALGGCGDTLAALRGTERLLFDCAERPDQVHAAEEFLMDMWSEHYDILYEIIREADEGSTCWFSLWSPGRFYAAHNDFSYAIGPDMFRELFLPVIRKQTEFLDHTVYHVDGVEAFRHVEALCELPRLQAIQILPGAGKPSPLHYMAVLKQVQKAGKNLHISIGADEVETALANLSARGLFINTGCRTEAEARDLLKNAERWSVDRG